MTEKTRDVLYEGLYDLQSSRAQQLIAEQRARRGKDWEEWKKVDIDSIRGCLAGERLDVARVEATFKLLWNPDTAIKDVSESLALPGDWGQKIASEAGKLVELVKTDPEARLVLSHVANTALMGVRDSKKLAEIKSNLSQVRFK